MLRFKMKGRLNTSHKFSFIFQLPIVGLSVEYIDIDKY